MTASDVIGDVQSGSAQYLYPRNLDVGVWVIASFCFEPFAVVEAGAGGIPEEEGEHVGVEERERDFRSFLAMGWGCTAAFVCLVLGSCCESFVMIVSGGRPALASIVAAFK